MHPYLMLGEELISRGGSPQPGDVIAFKAGDVIIVHRLIARLPYPFHNWGLQRGEVSEPISGVGQAAEIACHLAWGAASRAKRIVMCLAGQ